MADPLSLGASIIAFIQVAEGVIRASSFCIDAIQDAPTDLQMILCEVTSIKFIVEGLGRPDSGHKADSISLLARLFARSGPVDACKRCLSELDKLLPSEAKQGGSVVRNGRGFRRISAAQLAWPFKQCKARKLLAELSHHKATLLLAISGDISHDLKDIQSALSHLSDVVSDSDKREIFRWLEKTNPSSLQTTTFRKHEPHTSTWMLRLPEWENWLSGKHLDRSLWIHGPPGTGKTVLAAFLIEEIQNHCDISLPGSKMGCAYYYCHYSHDQDECAPFLSWTLSQACRQTQYVPGKLKRMYDRGCEPSIPELESALELVLEQLDVLYVVVDAIDESNPRSELVNLIATLVLDTRFRKIRILATSRPYFEIERVFGGIFGSVVSMSNAAVKADIRKMVNSRLASSYRLRRWRDEHQRIEDLLVAKSDGMFQWAELQLRKIERLRDISQLEEALQNLPADLAETYTRILSAIPPEDQEYVRRVLIWVIGHSNAAWLTSNGIDAELLVSAAEYDLYGRAKQSSSLDIDRSFDVERLRELSDCILTFKCVSGEELDDTSMTSSTTTLVDDTGVGSALGKAVYAVSVSHYTVVEFLESYILSNPSVSYFSLPQGVIRYEFATSIFRQAIEADPNRDGTSATDWETDREAYCLTLGCAIAFYNQDDFDRDLEAGEADDLADLALAFFNPSNPHFSRFGGIQRRIAADPDVSGVYYLGSLPSRFRKVGGDFMTDIENEADDIAAKTLLCMLSMSTDRYKGTLITRCIQRLLHMTGRDLSDLMNTRVAGYRTVRAWQMECFEQVFEGTVGQCLDFAPNMHESTHVFLYQD
ncbi:hypothetical protein V8F33_001871 [Rhypophila sp. PSN 637]